MLKDIEKERKHIAELTVFDDEEFFRKNSLEIIILSSEIYTNENYNQFFKVNKKEFLEQ